MRNQLTKREFEVAQMRVWTGRNKAVAVNLGISVKTVENTLVVVCDKLDIDSSELTATYMEQELGAVRPPYIIVSQVSLARKLREVCSSVILLGVLMGQFSDSFDAQRTFRSPRRTARTLRSNRRMDFENYIIN